MLSLQMTLMEHVCTLNFQNQYPCSNSGPVASGASALTTELSCLTFEENVLSDGLHLGVPSSFLQDRVMGKINADSAKSGPASLVP